MADYYQRRDMQSVFNFTDVNAIFEFGFLATQQSMLNESSDAVYEISWNGTDVHGQLSPTGPTAAISWEVHPRVHVYIRRQTGSGGSGAKFFQILSCSS